MESKPIGHCTLYHPLQRIVRQAGDVTAAADRTEVAGELQLLVRQCLSIGVAFVQRVELSQGSSGKVARRFR